MRFAGQAFAPGSGGGTHTPSLPVEQTALRDGVNGLASRMYAGRSFHAQRACKWV